MLGPRSALGRWSLEELCGLSWRLGEVEPGGAVLALLASWGGGAWRSCVGPRSALGRWSLEELCWALVVPWGGGVLSGRRVSPPGSARLVMEARVL